MSHGTIGWIPPEVMLFMPNEIYYMEISAEVYEALHRLQVTDQFFVCRLVGANASMHQEH